MHLQCIILNFIFNRATLITVVSSKISEIESLYNEALSKVKEIVDEFY